MNLSKTINYILVAFLIILGVLAFQNTNYLIFAITAVLAIVWLKSVNQMKKERNESLDFLKSKSYAKNKTNSSFIKSSMPPSTISPAQLSELDTMIQNAKNMQDANESDILKATSQSGIVAKSFASIEDAIKLGWQFKEQIGSMGNQKIYKLAINDGRTWEFDGLSHEISPMVIPDNIRLFGRFQYQESNKT